MKGIRIINTVVVIACVSLGLAVLGGCSLFYKPYKPSKPFPTEIPDISKYSITYNAKGKFFLSDKDGKALQAEHISLSKLLAASNMERSDWLTVLGSFKLYQVKADQSVWLCNENFQCFRGVVQKDRNSAVLSLNWNGDNLFVSDATGKKVEPKELRPFAKLVEEAELKAKYGIKELSTFTVYKIIGSQILSDCLYGRCLCVCLHSDGSKSPCTNGTCE